MARVPPPPRSQGARAYAAWHRKHGSDSDAVSDPIRLSRRKATAALGSAISRLNGPEWLGSDRRAGALSDLQAALSHLGIQSLTIDENVVTLANQIESNIVDEIFVEVD